MEFLENPMGGSTCVRTGFLSTEVSAPNAYGERAEAEENGASVLKAFLEEAANDGTMDSIVASMTSSSSPPTPLTQFAMKIASPANVTTANEYMDRGGEREDENRPWQSFLEWNERTADVPAPSDRWPDLGLEGGADVSLQTYVPAPPSPCGQLTSEKEDSEMNASDLSAFNLSSFSFLASSHEEKAPSLEKDQAGLLEYNDESRAVAVGSQTASGPVGCIPSSVQDVTSGLDSIDINQISKSEPDVAVSQQKAYSAPLDGEAELLRIQYSCSSSGVWRLPAPSVLSHGAVENSTVNPSTYPTPIRPLQSPMPTPECETDSFQRDGPNCPPCLSPSRLPKLAQAFYSWCKKSGKEKAKLRVCFIPRQIIEGYMTVKREQNGFVSLAAEQYAEIAKRWFSEGKGGKGRDSYNFKIALKKTFKPFDNKLTVDEINGGDGRKFVFSEKLTRMIYEELDGLENVLPSAANHGNRLPEANGGQSSSATGVARERRSRASGGRTRRRQNRRGTRRTTHRQAGLLDEYSDGIQAAAIQSASVSSIPSPAQVVASRLDSIGNNLTRETEHASQETWESLMSGGPQAAVAVFQKIAYSTPLLHGEEYLRIQYGPSWDPAPCRLSHETVEDFISVNPAANHGNDLPNGGQEGIISLTTGVARARRSRASGGRTRRRQSRRGTRRTTHREARHTNTHDDLPRK
ncbi:uncharacterized protein [Oscarella lobularis]|uniref:uncharacterized protein isoform X2 n=1 Tax=Oscarella lobularis TaxID=121494 RepID=UPI003313BDDA